MIRALTVIFAGLALFACACPDSGVESKPIAKAGVGYASMAVIKSDGTLWYWGNTCPTTTNAAVQRGGDKDWASVSVGFWHIMAKKTDGSLWALGSNFDGEFGNGSYGRQNSCTPVRTGSDSDWESVSAGGQHTMAIKKNGTLWGWGDNYSGQLGIGTTNEPGEGPNSPVQVGTAMDWQQIFAGGRGTFAIKKNGTLWAWGRGYSGNGDPLSTFSLVPIQVGTESNWAIISESLTHVLAIKTNGTLWGWGDQNHGELGTGVSGINSPTVLTPIQIGDDSDWGSASAGDRFSLAVKKDGTLWGWGNSLCNTVSDGKTIPFQIGSDSDWSNVSAGDGNPPAAAAIKKDNSIWTWGCNDDGQLGTGDKLPRAMPTQISF